MGYETKAFVVQRYHHFVQRDVENTLENPEYLSTLGFVELFKDGSGMTNFGRLREHYTSNPIEDGRVFGLWKFGCGGIDTENYHAIVRSGIFDNDTDILDELKSCIDEAETKDCYDHPIVLIPLDEAIEALQKDQIEEPYRRFAMLLALLKATREGFEGSNVYVATYGH